MKRFIICLLFFISIFCLKKETIKDEPLTDKQIEEIEILINNYVKENKKVLDDYFKLKMANSDICNSCQNFIEILQTILLQKYGVEGVYEGATLLCSIFLRKDVCYGAISRYGPYLLDSLIKRYVDKYAICNAVNLCNTTIEYIDIEEYAQNILKDKPERNVPKINETANILKVLQISDIHLDPNYKEGAIANCDIPLCCRDMPENNNLKNYVLAGKYGHIGKCDSNVELVDAFSQEASKLKPDFILFTGDNIAHNVWEDTQEEVVEATKIQIDIMKKYFKDIPIYPALGNHEKAPVDEFYGPESVLLNGLADIFKEYLPKEAEETFRKYGFYTLLHKNTNLRIISLNCIICDTMNFNLIFDASQAKFQFDWLENVLSNAEKNGEIVYIQDHIPIGSHQHTYQCSYRMKILMDRYQNIIRGYFSGHSHSEYLTIVTEYYNKNKPVQIDYVSSGLTTYSDYQPSFRLYEVDSDTKLIKDYIQYRMNLSESNRLREPVWFISYNATKLFGVKTLSDIDGIYNFKINAEYIIKKYTDTEEAYEKSKKQSVIDNEVCSFKYDLYEEYFKCTNSWAIFDPESLLTNVLNYLMGDWKKN